MKDLPSAQHSHAEHEERENSPAAKQMKGMQNERLAHISKSMQFITLYVIFSTPECRVMPCSVGVIGIQLITLKVIKCRLT